MVEQNRHSDDEEITQQQADIRQSAEENQGTASEGQREETESPSLELVEVVPGTAVVFGDVPKGLDLSGFGLIPPQDRDALSTVLGAVGNAGTIGGNMANGISSAQGLYRVNEATLSLLKSGGQLASKDGAKLGSIFKNGQLVAQARFVPVSMAASAVAAIGPAVAMAALQMKLDEISGLVKTNIALTEQTLRTINQEQWAELAGLSSSINRAVEQAEQVGQVTMSIWENIAGNEPIIDKQLNLYQQKVSTHIQQLRRESGTARQDYLRENAEAILFDSNALLYALRGQAGYQTIRAAHARAVGQQEQDEARLAEVIEQSMHDEIDAGIENARELVAALIRELRIVAELPGRASLPLTKSWRAAKSSRLSCRRLLDSLEPLANVLHPMPRMMGIPAIVCAPDDVDLDAYLNILRWYMNDGERLEGLVFAYHPGEHDLMGMIPQMLGKRVDAVWSSLDSSSLSVVINTATSAVIVAITSGRILVATPRGLLRSGTIAQNIPRADIRFIRSPQNGDEGIRRTIDVVAEHDDLRLMFPQMVSDSVIEDVIRLLDDETGVENKAKVAAADAATQLEVGNSHEESDN
jgi:hypothetical protein